ncbi:unnamed protein product [Amoebophrya sp. A25]|nr:unnamed protein product [Amoebophrya sp. A25]|eukprot:GSA25T00000305001.1
MSVPVVGTQQGMADDINAVVQQPTRALSALHVLGSSTDDFYFKVSLLYSKACHVFPTTQVRNQYAIVCPDGAWFYCKDSLDSVSLEDFVRHLLAYNKVEDHEQEQEENQNKEVSNNDQTETAEQGDQNNTKEKDNNEIVQNKHFSGPMTFGQCMRTIEQNSSTKETDLDLIVPHTFDFPGMTSMRAMVEDYFGVSCAGPEMVHNVMAQDKSITRAVLQQAGIRVPNGQNLVMTNWHRKVQWIGGYAGGQGPASTTEGSTTKTQERTSAGTTSTTTTSSTGTASEEVQGAASENNPTATSPALINQVEQELASKGDKNYYNASSLGGGEKHPPSSPTTSTSGVSTTYSGASGQDDSDPQPINIGGDAGAKGRASEEDEDGQVSTSSPFTSSSNAASSQSSVPFGASCKSTVTRGFQFTTEDPNREMGNNVPPCERTSSTSFDEDTERRLWFQREVENILAGQLTMQPPFVVKPSREDNSRGVGLVKCYEDILPKCLHAFKYGETVVVEEVIPGREMRCGVLQQRIDGELVTRPLPAAIEYFLTSPDQPIRGETDKLTSKSKNSENGNKVTDNLVQTKCARAIPAVLSRELEAELNHQARGAFEALHGRDFGLFDFRVHAETNLPHVIECCTFWSFSPISAISLMLEGGKEPFQPAVLECWQLAAARTKTKRRLTGRFFAKSDD